MKSFIIQMTCLPDSVKCKKEDVKLLELNYMSGLPYLIILTSEIKKNATYY